MFRAYAAQRVTRDISSKRLRSEPTSDELQDALPGTVRVLTGGPCMDASPSGTPMRWLMV
jgi:hypothetical protein